MLTRELCNLQKTIAQIALVEEGMSGDKASRENFHKRIEELVYASTKWIIDTHKASMLEIGRIPK
jgi:hypothetical protein